MRLKILIPPLFIVSILILAIGYIKPDFEVMQMKKADIRAKEADVEKMDTIVANIDALNSSLDTRQEFEKLAYRYLPNTQSQEQVIDAFNFLATQSGVVIVKMDLKPSPSQKASPGEGSGEVTDASQAAVLPVAKTFTFTGSVIGSYENIKIFFDRLAHAERFQRVSFFSIENAEITQSPAGKEQPLDTNRLIGTFEAEFGYLPPEPIASALNMPIARNSEFDFSNANRLLEQMTSPIPTLEKGQT
ncbi:MAG: hypothetical protein Q8Q10_02050, partial [bacterium]|nr:hypothetical protein [bacterium]